mgnify:CR=1 FL=1
MMANQMNSNVPTHSAKLFTWNGNEGSIEESALPSHYYDMYEYYDGGKNMSFYVHSPKTNVKKLFTHVYDHYNEDGDLVHSLWKADDKFTIIIYND